MNRFECELPREVRRNFQTKVSERKESPRKPAGDDKPAGGIGRLQALVLLLILVVAGICTLKAPGPAANPSVVQPTPTPAPEVRRAELVAPKALPVIGESYPIRLPNGTVVETTFRGYLPNANALPLHGGRYGDMYGVSGNYWILSNIGNRLGWIDP